MRTVSSILLLSIFYIPSSAQYFFTGEVKGTHGDNLQHVSISVLSTGETYKTTPSGSFEIISRKTDDSITFSVEGYEHYSTTVSTNEFLRVTLKELTVPVATKRNSLLSVIDSRSATVSFPCNSNGITYSNIKRFLNMGMQVPAEAVKVEEMCNYLNFYYEDPEDKELFHCSSDLLSCPWNEKHRLLCLNICAKKAILQEAPPSNLVFLIDVTGSMDMPNKLPLVKSSLHLLVKNLRDIDTVSLIEYGGRGRILQGIPGNDKDRLIRAIEQLSADGPAPGDNVLNIAYKIAAGEYIPEGNNRLILITDGDISSTMETRQDLVNLVGDQYNDSIHLTCLGAGLNKDESSELPLLARAGHGNFACIEDAQQGEKLLLDELDKGLSGIADKACVTAGFDTTLVQEYHLLGFENKSSALGDTTLRLEGSSISSGNAQLVLFEIVPKKDSAELENIADIHIRYCLPGQHQAKDMQYSCPNKPAPFEKAPATVKQAVCIALFGMKLKGASDAARFSWADMEKLTKKAFTGNKGIDRDYIAMMAQARKIYEHAR